MKGAILQKKNSSFISVAILIGILLFSSLANADIFSPDDYRPDWWDEADARIIFDQLPTENITVPIASEGTKGYDYTAIYSELQSVIPSVGDIRLTSLNIHLNNEENPNKIKRFWVAFRYDDKFPAPTPSDVNIIGHYEDGSLSPVTEFDSFVVDNDWVFAEASLSPQPAWEDIEIQVQRELNSKPFYSVDYLEVGTYCETPIPSSLFLLGGGIFWLFNLKRRKN